MTRAPWFSDAVAVALAVIVLMSWVARGVRRAARARAELARREAGGSRG